MALSSQENVSSSSTISINPESTTRQINKKAPELPILERRNWLLHLHYIRKDFQTCKTLIGEQLEETGGTCEYALYVKALILREEGKIRDSLELFQACCTLNGSPANLKQVARSFILLGQHRDALAVYEEANKTDQPDWEILHNVGLCHLHLKDIAKAKECLTQSVRLRGGGSPDTLAALAEAHLTEGDVQAALTALQSASELRPEDFELSCQLGLLYVRAGMYQKGFEKLGMSLAQAGGNHLGAMLGLGHVMQTHGDLDVALARYRPAAVLAPQSAALWTNVAMCFYGKKKYVAAISCLKRAHYLAPLDPRPLYNLGLVHLTMQQSASAFHFLNTAVQLSPRNGACLLLLAVALTQLRDHDNAAHAYEKALKCDSEDPLVPLNYAIFQLGRGETELACKQLQGFDERWQRSAKPLAREVFTMADRVADHLKMKEQIFQKRPATAYSPLDPAPPLDHLV